MGGTDFKAVAGLGTLFDIVSECLSLAGENVSQLERSHLELFSEAILLEVHLILHLNCRLVLFQLPAFKYFKESKQDMAYNPVCKPLQKLPADTLVTQKRQHHP